MPVPEGAVVRGFTFSGAAKEPTAEVLPKAAATATYKAIVAKMRDPALLEFAGLQPDPLQRLPASNRTGRREVRADLRAPAARRRRPRRLRAAADRIDRLQGAVGRGGEDQGEAADLHRLLAQPPAGLAARRPARGRGASSTRGRDAGARPAADSICCRTTRTR